MTMTSRRRNKHIGLMLFVLLAATCQADPGPGGEEGGAAHALSVPREARVVYELSFSWDGARWDEGEKAHVFTTDRGYTVGLYAGYVSTASVELVPCREGANGEQGRLGHALGAARRFLGPALAFANHAYNHDGTLVGGPVVESISREAARELGVGVSAGKRYCRLHVLAAPVEMASDDGFHMNRWSAYVRGFYQGPGSGERHAFDAHVNLRGGALVDLREGERLTEPAVAADGKRAAAKVVVKRSPARAFDGVRFEKLTPSEVAYAFLRGLGKATEASYRTGP